MTENTTNKQGRGGGGVGEPEPLEKSITLVFFFTADSLQPQEQNFVQMQRVCQYCRAVAALDGQR